MPEELVTCKYCKRQFPDPPDWYHTVKQCRDFMVELVHGRKDDDDTSN